MSDLQARLEQLDTERRLAAEHKAKADELRDKLVPEMRDAGTLFLTNARGQAVQAYAAQTTTVVIDERLLSTLVSSEVFRSLFDAPTLSPARFRRAVTAGQISESVMARVARVVTKSETIRFSAVDEELEDG